MSASAHIAGRPWLAHYPEGVPADIDTSAYRSVVDMLEESFTRYRTQDAYICMGKRLSYGALDTASHHLAAYLQSIGLQRGERVAVMLPNLLQYPIAVAAILRAGCVVVNVNPMYTARELAHQLSDSGASAIVILENFAHTLQQVLPSTGIKHVVLATVGDQLGALKGAITNFVVRRVRKAVPAYQLPGAVGFNTALRRGASRPLRKPGLGPDDVAVLQYTGGTTGLSKGAVLVHRNLVANALASEAWLAPGLRGRPRSGQFTIVCALPLYHVFAFVSCAMLGMRTGGVNLLIPDPRDVGGMIRTLSRHKIHLLPAVNTLFNALVHHPDGRRLDLSELCISNGGGTAVQEAVAEAWVKLTGNTIIEGYGMTETASAVTCNTTSVARHDGSIGLPLPGVWLRIVKDDGQDAALGEPGEIAVRGPQVMQGYWNQPQETADAFTPDGFFKTGDIGVMDAQGRVRIVDRKKDMILVSGFNVFPNEIEGVVAHHPGVRECAVVGVPDVHSGEAVMLCVVKRDEALTEESLLAYCAEHLTGYKRPRRVRFSNELPKSNVGKILRRELRQQASSSA